MKSMVRPLIGFIGVVALIQWRQAKVMNGTLPLLSSGALLSLSLVFLRDNAATSPGLQQPCALAPFPL